MNVFVEEISLGCVTTAKMELREKIAKLLARTEIRLVKLVNVILTSLLLLVISLVQER